MPVKKKSQSKKTRWKDSVGINIYANSKRTEYDKGYTNGYEVAKSHLVEREKQLVEKEQEIARRDILSKIDLIGHFGQSIQAMADLLRRAKE